ncbi:hypothetical protein [Bacillus thuringiensis]|uniref:hypothetical protein n=1 Tax=Bacillus thuringiensis TaxID=1428 RepID=UPI001E598180|nr:hypothetical protein [Bacillus thuringiensis]MCC2541638.1 hypothetical protein [Bacillus thuringiensis]
MIVSCRFVNTMSSAFPAGCKVTGGRQVPILELASLIISLSTELSVSSSKSSPKSIGESWLPMNCTRTPNILAIVVWWFSGIGFPFINSLTVYLETPTAFAISFPLIFFFLTRKLKTDMLIAEEEVGIKVIKGAWD